MQLSENAAMRRAVKAAVENGMPTVAECGGFLYLHTTLQGAQGALYPMAGVFDAAGYPTGKLGRFGYVTLTAREENLLCPPGGQLPAHEFHYWDSTAPGNAFTAQKPQRKTGWDCAVATKTLYAGFPHLYFPGKPDVAVRFLRAAASYAPPKAEGER